MSDVGMRMKVAVGYGLDLTGLNTDFVTRFENLEDESVFNEFLAASLKSADEREDLQDKMSIGFAVGTKANPVPANEVPRAFYETIDFDQEFAFEDKMLLYPLGYKRNWSRYSNLLDSFIYEAYQKPGGYEPTPEWREKPGTLYPFVSLMRANPEKPLGVEQYWKFCYLDSVEHRDAIPTAPMHLWHLIKHLRLTRDDAHTTETFLSLRPTLMRWWS